MGATGFIVRYRFAGRECTSESRLYYMPVRYYDPALGRWISENPIGIAGGGNLFEYAGNDPINATDPSGLDPWCSDGLHVVDWHWHDGDLVPVCDYDRDEFKEGTFSNGDRPSFPVGGSPYHPPRPSPKDPRPGQHGGRGAGGPRGPTTEPPNPEVADCTEKWLGAGVSFALDFSGARLIGAAGRGTVALWRARSSIAFSRRLAQEAGYLARGGRAWMPTAEAAWAAEQAGRAELRVARFAALKGGIGAAFVAAAPEFSLFGETSLLQNAPFYIGTTVRSLDALTCTVRALTH